MAVPEPPTIVVVGAAARDLDASDPRGWRLGGGVSYGALLAARLGFRVGALIGLDADARDAAELERLRAAGVALHVVPLERGPVFYNAATPQGRRQIAHVASDPIEPSAMPAAWWDARAILLAPVAGEVEDAWADALPADRLVGVAWQGFLRRIVADRPVEALPARPTALFARADIGGVSGEDLRAGGDDLASILPNPGQELVITGGDAGAVHLCRTEHGFDVRAFPVVPARYATDPTGAGDAFLTGWIAARTGGGPFRNAPLRLDRAMFVAATLASLAVEGVGLDGVPDTAMFRARVAELRNEP